MADHCRKQIRDAIVAGLALNLIPGTVAIVDSARVNPFAGEVLPALLVVTAGETIRQINKAQDGARTLKTVLEIYAMGADVQDACDLIAKTVEPLILQTLPIWVKSIDPTGMALELSGDAYQPAGVMRIEYDIVYHVNPAAPDVPL
jgi:hypothetical protein